MKHRIDAVFIGIIGTALLAATTMASGAVSQSDEQAAWDFTHQPAGPLVQAVRDATARYQDVSRAEADGYIPVLGCVSGADMGAMGLHRSEEHTSELQSLMRISYAVFCLKKKKQHKTQNTQNTKHTHQK